MPDMSLMSDGVEVPATCRLIDTSEGIGEIWTVDKNRLLARYIGGGSPEQTTERLSTVSRDVPRVVFCEDQWDAPLAPDWIGAWEVLGIQIWPDRRNPGESAEQIMARCAPRFDEAARRTSKPLVMILRQSDGRQTADSPPFYAFDLQRLFRAAVPLLRRPQVRGLLSFSL